MHLDTPNQHKIPAFPVSLPEQPIIFSSDNVPIGTLSSEKTNILSLEGKPGISKFLRRLSRAFGNNEKRASRASGTVSESRKQTTQQSAKLHSILFVTRCYPPTTGGMERFAKDLHDVVSLKTHTKLLSWGGSKGALIFILPYFFLRSFWLLLTSKIDVIHAQDGVVSIVMVPLSKLFKKPLIVVIHGLDVTYKTGLYQMLIKWSLGRASRVACISSAAKVEVVGRGIDAEKVVVIPLGITDELFMDDKKRAKAEVQKFVPKLESNTKLILSVGRLVKRKGVDWFVANVLPSVVESSPDIVFVVSGEGAWRPSIEAVIEDSKMQDHVLLLGRSSDEQLKYLYNAADCFVMPNITVPGDMEGFGRVLLEAALCKVPIVASGIEGIVDAIKDGQNGTLVTERDAPEYIRVILEILGNPELALDQGKRARTYTLEHYGWPTIADSYISFYREISKGRVS